MLITIENIQLEELKGKGIARGVDDDATERWGDRVLQGVGKQFEEQYRNAGGYHYYAEYIELEIKGID